MFIFNVLSIGYRCKYIPTQHRLKLVQNSKNQLSKGPESKMLPQTGADSEDNTNSPLVFRCLLDISNGINTSAQDPSRPE